LAQPPPRRRAESRCARAGARVDDDARGDDPHRRLHVRRRRNRGLAQLKLETDPGAAATVLASARERLAVGLEELREIARGLHPAILSRGLEVALAGVAERAPVPVELHVDEGERLAEPVEAAAYYVVSEGLTNVARYAKTTNAGVQVTREATRLGGGPASPLSR
jgi:signal transduction histidine kinase